MGELCRMRRIRHCIYHQKRLTQAIIVINHFVVLA